MEVVNTISRPEYKMLSAVVPVFNERNCVGEAVRRMRGIDVPKGLEYEIVVVDDGSTDGTDKVLSSIEDSTVRVIRQERNLGKGAAIRTGIDAARGDLLVIQGAGLEYDPADWHRLLAPLLEGKTQVVFGSRRRAERAAGSLTKLLVDRVVTIATCLAFNTTVSDVETGMKAFDRNVFQQITIESDRFEFEPEIAAKLLKREVPIFEVPISYASRDKERRPTGRDNLKALEVIAKQRFFGR